MKKLFSSLIFIGLLMGAPAVYAQGMMGQIYNTNYTTAQNITDTANDEAKGKTIFDQLQSKQVDCKNLTDDDFDVLGDYFMGQMAGNGHASMNIMMTRMMGEEGEKQMHIVMGKRLSGCDSAAALPPQYQNFSAMPMISGYGYNYQDSAYQPSGNMMSGFGISNTYVSSWVSLILFWTVLVLLIVALAKYIKGSSKRK